MFYFDKKSKIIVQFQIIFGIITSGLTETKLYYCFIFLLLLYLSINPEMKMIYHRILKSVLNIINKRDTVR